MDRRALGGVAVVGMCDGRAAGLEVERARHPVACTEPAAGEGLGVAVKIDETRGHDQSSRLYHSRPTELTLGHCGDRATGDADVADGIEARLGVDDDSVANHEVELGHTTTLDAARRRLPGRRAAQGTSGLRCGAV